MRRVFVWVTFILVLGAALFAEPKPKPNALVNSPVRNEMALRIGEQRYLANCSRCHQAPPKFPPGAMATVIRHMRVRAMITDEDMHAILQFMTQ
jgi:mono/diheme cytochrome c family protein